MSEPPVGLPCGRGKDAHLGQLIQSIHQLSRGTYGAPRIHAELSARGRHVGRKRVARLMREKGLRGVSRRKWTTTTVRDRAAAVAPDLVKRDFRAEGPNQLWVADITYVPTWARFLYVAVVLDAWNRRVVGWAFALHLRVEETISLPDLSREFPNLPFFYINAERPITFLSCSGKNRFEIDLKFTSW